MINIYDKYHKSIKTIKIDFLKKINTPYAKNINKQFKKGENIWLMTIC